jgi:hypothetical protein
MDAARSTSAEGDVLGFERPYSTTEPLEFVELELWPPPQGQRQLEFPLSVAIRFRRNFTLSTPNWTHTISLRHVELKLTLQGCEIVRGSRFGDEPARSFNSIEEQHSKKQETQISFATNLSLRKLADIAVGLQHQVKSAVSQLHTKQINNFSIQALPHDQWLYSSIDRQCLEGLYQPIDDEEKEIPLCRLRTMSGAIEIRASIAIRSEYLKIDSSLKDGANVSLALRSGRNAEVIKKLLVSKAFRKQVGRQTIELAPICESIMRARPLHSQEENDAHE